MLLWSSFDQVRHGTTKYRKTIGAVTLVGALSRTVQAEHARAVRDLQRVRQPQNLLGQKTIPETFDTYSYQKGTSWPLSRNKTPNISVTCGNAEKCV